MPSRVGQWLTMMIIVNNKKILIARQIDHEKNDQLQPKKFVKQINCFSNKSPIDSLLCTYLLRIRNIWNKTIWPDLLEVLRIENGSPNELNVVT